MMAVALEAGRLKVLVLGASGHLGNAIVRALLDAGHHVSATSRRVRPARNVEGLDLQYLVGDADVPGQLDRWVHGHDVVVDAGAPYPIHLFVKAESHERDPIAHAEHRSYNLLAAVRRERARLVYVGSFVTGNAGRRAHFRSFARSIYPYFEVKARIESIIMEAVRGGAPAVIVNPTACLGPWDVKPRELCLIPHVLAGQIAFVPQHVINVLDVRDLAAVVVRAIATEHYGERIALSGHNLSVSSLVRWVCDIGGVQPPRLRVPAPLALAASLWTEAAFGMTGMRSPSPSLAMALLCESAHTEPSRAQRALGFELTPLSRTLRDAIDWYRELGYC